MADFEDALRAKIADLEEEKARLEAKIAVLVELIGDADLTDRPTVARMTGARKPGRPPKVVAKKSMGTPKSPSVDEKLLREAEANLNTLGGGTDPEQAKQIAKKYAPMSRTPHSYGSVKVLTKSAARKKQSGEVEQGTPMGVNTDEE